ncbi:hypothetical protein [Pleionea litopenaei]|uniref:Uncharacterized protein n=1 Tax=Pleionea litopenaei TaxID=3070815 RepID=A0AA51X7Z6_9GAMM|nr:hypothetical protein [Pleionea sp. HL-JVS1]WMS88406.1 hypothetical protein Q9312_05695 [Pleionea sp. HL-JVS1]
MKNLKKLLFTSASAFFFTLGGSVAVADTTSSVCTRTHCTHCINNFCVSCDLNTGSCRPVARKEASQ